MSSKLCMEMSFTRHKQDKDANVFEWIQVENMFYNEAINWSVWRRNFNFQNALNFMLVNREGFLSKKRFDFHKHVS